MATLIAATQGARAANFLAPTVIDFEDLAPGTTVVAQYGIKGVLFGNHHLHTDPAAHSGQRVLRSASPSSEIFTPIPIVMTFTSAQARVKLFAMHPAVPNNGTLTAFDASGNIVATDGPRTVAPDVFTTMFEVTDPDATPSITRVELRMDGSAHFAIDDLEFEGQPPAPPPPTAPVVTFTSPIDGANVDQSNIDITGTVTGEGLLNNATLVMEVKQAPGSTAPPFTTALPLTGTGTTLQFSLPQFGVLGLGPIKFTVSAQNFAGMTGTSSVTITNMPTAIRNRYESDGGAATYGAFSHGRLPPGGVLAIFEQGAIGLRDGQAFRVRADILAKALSIPAYLQANFLSSLPFNELPRGEERESLGCRIQDFETFRVFVHPATGAVFTPSVFVNALDKRGAEFTTGIPMADPTNSIGLKQTWLFQRFFRPDDPSALPSTLEIRGTPPVLYLQRQGGAWFHNKFAPSPADVALNKMPATLWESFPCDGNLGPCAVPDEPTEPVPHNPNVGDLFCNGKTYIPALEGVGSIPAEWVPVQGDYVATEVTGLVISAHMTDIDNGLTHETHTANCPYLDAGLAIGSVVVGLPIAVGGYLAANEYGLTCASDFEYFIVPIGSHGNTAPLPSLFGKKNTDRIKTEYEVAYASAAHAFLGTPAPGDLIHTTGRWIVDCGHDTYKTELHPIFSYARMKTVTTETNSFTGLEEDLFDGRPATRAGIWVNGWYPGGEGNEIEFEIYPPPRPSPEAVLHVVKPVDFAAGGYTAAEDVSMEFSLEPPGAATFVRLRFSAPLRQNTVTDAGEMKFESGRQYWGIWYLYWK